MQGGVAVSLYSKGKEADNVLHVIHMMPILLCYYSKKRKEKEKYRQKAKAGTTYKRKLPYRMKNIGLSTPQELAGTSFPQDLKGSGILEAYQCRRVVQTSYGAYR